MRTKTGVVGRLALAGIALVMACSDSPSPATPGRGSAACNEWQTAYCGFAMKCNANNVNTICDQVKAFACKSDTEAKRCADAINAASCTAPPAGCDALDIADPAPAKKACEDYRTAFCKRIDECQPGSMDACVAEFNKTLMCEKAIGVAAGYEACMPEIPKLVCANVTLPDVCRGILIFTP
jgi:hypothetical protein